METFINRNGLRLAYKFSIKNPEDKRIYIVCQMVFFDMDSFIYSFISQHLRVNTFRFDFPGNGKSDGKFTYAGHISEAGDIDDAVKFLNSLGYKVEGIIGHSKSAIDAIIYSAIYGQIRQIFAISPKFDMSYIPQYMRENDAIVKANGHIVRYAFGCTREMIDEIMSIDMRYYCRRAQGEFYIIHGSLDEIIPYIDSLQYASALKEKCKGHYTLECDHLLNGALDEVVEIIHHAIEN
ncbi:unnamed protein product [Blepharisma stoltei]|uniref:Serine aminopeptidase S33 domain-containing protein n=1 Tax=Blepharisma stoltei TaxID=1481888 RepID=A0AAU9JVQ4_9CILI|nr:unnamed protein product [Blepharisma stoltei]